MARLLCFAFLSLMLSSLHIAQTGNLHLFHSFEDIENLLDSMQNEYPHIISKKKSIGESVHGRNIWAVKISDNPDIDEDEPEVFYNSLIHGTEPMSMMVLIYFMEHLLNGYELDSEVKYLVDNRELFFVPVVNPDGYILSKRKNRRDNGDGTFGVDLNRNFGYMWNGGDDSLNTSPGSHMYRGPAPFSEPEARAIRDFCLSRNFILANNIHYYGYWIYYPWGFNLTQPADSNKFKTFTSLATELNNYSPGLSYFPTSGTAMDWMYSEQSDKPKIFAFTTEVGGDFQYNILYPTADEIKLISEQNIHPNKIYAWGVGLTEEIPLISDVTISKSYLQPGIDTLWISAIEELSDPATDVLAQIIDSENNIVDTVTMSTSKLSDSRELAGRWIPTDYDKFYRLNILQTGREKPFQLQYGRRLNKCKFTTAGPLSVAIDEIRAHSFRDYKIKLMIRNYSTVQSMESLKIFINTPDTAITFVAPRDIFLNRIEPGASVSIAQNVYIDVDENFNGLFNFDFEIYSHEILYWKNSVLNFPVSTDEFNAAEYYRLKQNYPNPFNPATTIEYSIPVHGKRVYGESAGYSRTPESRFNAQLPVSLKVYDALGREVAILVNESQRPGNYRVTWNAPGNASGVYYYKLRAGSFIETRKMLILR